MKQANSFAGCPKMGLTAGEFHTLRLWVHEVQKPNDISMVLWKANWGRFCPMLSSRRIFRDTYSCSMNSRDSLGLRWIYHAWISHFWLGLSFLNCNMRLLDYMTSNLYSSSDNDSSSDARLSWRPFNCLAKHSLNLPSLSPLLRVRFVPQSDDSTSLCRNLNLLSDRCSA